jgi:hypothetical protein
MDRAVYNQGNRERSTTKGRLYTGRRVADVFGVSGRAMLRALIEGEASAETAERSTSLSGRFVPFSVDPNSGGLGLARQPSASL